MKAKRQAILLELLEQGVIRSQTEAVKQLIRRGIDATQATVSRDLEDIGAIKVREGKKTHYTLASKTPQFGAPLAKTLKEFVVHSVASNNMIVLHTPPGHAAFVAAAIDRAKLREILGTIAGDDTIFICCRPDVDTIGFAQKLAKLRE